LDVEKKMEKISKRHGIMGKIVEENDERIERALEELGLWPKESSISSISKLNAEQVYNALIKKTKETDRALFKHFHEPDFSTTVGCQIVINATKELTGDLSGFYLKKEKAAELLKLNPPKNIMAVLGYGADMEKMLANEDVFEIFSALRFVESEAWLNDVFFKNYETLKKEDFEKRKIKVMVLPEKWLSIGQKFLGRKLHHMSHLKELGVIFVIPTENYGPGETVYLFFMTLHYLYEVDWHAKLFRKYTSEDNFTLKMINALKVEVTGMPLPDKTKISWRIVAKYLGKKDPNDPRLFEPHISPEAWHYAKAGRAIEKFSERFKELGLGFWNDLGWVGEYFFLNGDKTLISFGLYDNGIALLKESGVESKYLYHQQEELWNKIFMEYMGEEELNRLMTEGMERGYITL
jgi:hypothetical protein